MCLLIKYRRQVADAARLGTGCPGRSGERRQSLLASRAEPVRTTYATSHTEAGSGLGPVVDSVGNTELDQTQASPKGAPGGDRSTDSVTQCGQDCDGWRSPEEAEIQLGSEKASKRRRQMTWVLKDKKK